MNFDWAYLEGKKKKAGGSKMTSCSLPSIKQMKENRSKKSGADGNNPN